MYVSDLFRQLSYGELSTLSMATNVPGAIDPLQQPKLIIHANEALLRLYSRFVLKEADLMLQMLDGVTNYHLLSQNTQSYQAAVAAGAQLNDPGGAEFTPTPYILDSGGQPFTEDVIKILAVYNGGFYSGGYGEDFNDALPPDLFDPLDQIDPVSPNDPTSQTDGVVQQDINASPYYWRRGDNASNSLPLNDREDPYSLFTPQPNVLQVPYPQPGLALGVQYQAKHADLVDNNLTQWIELPRILEGALKSYIAHKVFSFMNGQENKIAAQDHLANYESICVDVTDKGLVSTGESTTSVHFHRRGWV